MSRTKASFSHRQLVEFEGCLAQKLRFHIFNSWNVKDVSQESFVFMNHGCDLNVRICQDLHETLCILCFCRVNRGSVAEKSWFARATVLGVAALAWNVLELRAQWK